MDEGKGKGEDGVYSWNSDQGNEDLGVMHPPREELLKKFVEEGWLGNSTRKLDLELRRE